jgi:hypothetical protein
MMKNLILLWIKDALLSLGGGFLVTGIFLIATTAELTVDGLFWSVVLGTFGALMIVGSLALVILVGFLDRVG